MVRFIDECVGCPPEMGCRGASCPYAAVPRHFCDECGTMIDEDRIRLADDDRELCAYCYDEMLEAQWEEEGG